MNADFFEALEALAAERGITRDTLLTALADALESAYKRMPGANEYAWVTIDPDTAEIRVFAQWLDANGEPEGDELDVTPENFGRIAAQTAKQVMGQRLREIDREQKYEEYAGREGDIVTGIIQQNDSRYTLLDLGRVEALLPQAEQVPYERPEPGARVKAYIVEVRKTAKGPQIVVSRTHPGLIKRLFELEVPEIADGIVELQGLRPRAGPPHQDRGLVQRPQRRPGRRLRRRPRRPCPHGRQRAAGREDRHRPVLGGSARLRRQGAVAGEGQGGPDRRGDRHRHGHRPRLPAVAWPSARRARTPAWPPASPGGASTSRARRCSPTRRPGVGVDDNDYAEGEWIENPETGRARVAPGRGRRRRSPPTSGSTPATSPTARPTPTHGSADADAEPTTPWPTPRMATPRMATPRTPPRQVLEEQDEAALEEDGDAVAAEEAAIHEVGDAESAEQEEEE